MQEFVEEEKEELRNMVTGEVYVPEGEVLKKKKEESLPYQMLTGEEGQSEISQEDKNLLDEIDKVLGENLE